MVAAGRIGEHLRQEVALGDLQAGLVLLLEGALGVDLVPRGEHAGVALGGLVDQLGHTHRPLQAIGDLLVDPDDVVAGARAGDHAPPTTDSCPDQYGARSSRLSTLPAPDLGSGSAVSSMRLGIL